MLMKIKLTMKVMIGSVSRVLQIRNSSNLILVMMTGYQTQLSSLGSECCSNLKKQMGELKQRPSLTVYRISHREVFSKRTCSAKRLLCNVAVMDLCSAFLACFSGLQITSVEHFWMDASMRIKILLVSIYPLRS